MCAAVSVDSARSSVLPSAGVREVKIVIGGQELSLRPSGMAEGRAMARIMGEFGWKKCIVVRQSAAAGREGEVYRGFVEEAAVLGLRVEKEVTVDSAVRTPSFGLLCLFCSAAAVSHAATMLESTTQHARTNELGAVRVQQCYRPSHTASGAHMSADGVVG